MPPRLATVRFVNMPVPPVSKSTAPITISRGLIPSAARLALYGPEGVGKSTLTAGFPEPVFLDTEGGTAHLDVARFPRPRNWADVVAVINHLLTTEHGYKTLVIDSIDWTEKLLIEEVCRKANKDGIEDFGYGKGLVYLAEEFARFLALLEKLRDHGMHVVLVGHSTIRKFEAPGAAGSYDRYELKLAKQVAALTKEWVDSLLFLNYVTKVTEKDGKQRAVGGRERVIHTTHTAAWDAKNRYSLDEKLPCAVASLAPIFARVATPPTQPPPHTPAPAASAPAALAATATAPRPGPVLLVTREQVEKLDLYWATLKKTDADRVKAFAWLGANGIDNQWDELTAEQAAKLITKLQEQMNKMAEGSTSSASRAAARNSRGGAR